MELFRNLAGVIDGTAAESFKWEEVVTTLEIIEAAQQSSGESRTVVLP